MHILTLGLVALAQTCFIPGLIIVKLCLGKENLNKLLPTSFAISLIFNWVAIFYATKFGVFNTSFLYLIFAAELILTAVILLKKVGSSTSYIVEQRSDLNHNVRVISFIVVILAIFIVMPKLGHIFTDNDAVLSWNRWATIWATNQIPTDTMHYPQLLPANYALSYVLVGSTAIQFFAFAISIFFFPLACISFFNAAERVNDSRLHLANFFFFLFMILYGNMANGWADIPVACMSFISINLFILGWNETEKNKESAAKLILFSSLIAAGCAVTKQAGIFYSILNVIAVCIWVIRNYKEPLQRIKFIVLLFIAYLIVCLPWYIEAQHNINTGLNSSEIQYVTNSIYKGKSYLSRFLTAFIKWPGYFILALISLPAIRDRNYRWPTLAGILFLVVWALFFSYDSRNFTLGVPLLAIGAGAAWLMQGIWIPKISFKIPNIKYRLRARNMALIGSLIIITSALVPDKFLIELQEIQKVKVGNEYHNLALYNAFSKYGEGRVISNESLLPFASRMPKDVLLHYEFYDHTQDNEALFVKYLSDPKLRFIIVDSKGLSENIKLLIIKKLKDGTFKLIQNIKINRKREDPLYLVSPPGTHI